MKISKKKIIVLMSIIFILSRIIVLLFSPYIFHEEEFKRGALGHDLIFGDGLRMPIFGYMGSPHAGGSLFVQIETIPFYLLFGNIHLAVKVTALLNSYLFFLTVLLLLKKFFSKKHMIITSIFLILGNPHFIQKNLILHGNSITLSLIIMLMLYLTSTIFTAKKISNLRYLIWGFLLGFGMWLQYGSVTMIFLYLITILLKKIKFDKIIITALGFIAGFVPWIIYNVKYSLSSLYGDKYLYGKSINFFHLPERILETLTIHLPKSFHFFHISDVVVIMITYLFYILGTVGIILSIVSKLRKEKISYDTQVLILLILHFVIMVSLFILNDFTGVDGGFNTIDPYADYYTFSTIPFLLLLFGISISNIISIDYKRFYGFLALTIMTSIMLFGYISMLIPQQFNSYLFKPFHSTESLAFEFGINNIIYPKAFSKFYHEIKADNNVRISYVRGSSVGLVYLYSRGSITEENIDQINKSLSYLSEKDREIYWEYIVKGEENLLLNNEFPLDLLLFLDNYQDNKIDSN